MNANIKVINENLWAVNQYHVKAGYIQDIITFPGNEPEKKGISLTEQGVLILNTADPVYDVTKKLLLRIMERSDEQLQLALDKMQKVKKPDSYEKMYLNVLGWEVKRRCVKIEYLESLSKLTLKDKIIKFIRKVGDSSGIYPNRN